MKTVTREQYVKAVRAHKSTGKPIYGHSIAVMENFDMNGVYFAAAAYSKVMPGVSITPVYRVHEDYLTGD